jgi:hypothetical protein
MHMPLERLASICTVCKFDIRYPLGRWMISFDRDRRGYRKTKETGRCRRFYRWRNILKSDAIDSGHLQYGYG